MKEQKKGYDLIAKLDTEGDIILGVTKKQDNKIVVTIITPNNEENSQLLENLFKMVENPIKNDGHSFSFEVEEQEGLFIINLANNSVLYLDEALVPREETGDFIKEGTNEVVLKEKIYAATKIRLAQKTDFELTVNETVFSSPEYVEESKSGNSIEIGKTDLHNHLAGLLPPNRLVALGIRHNVDYNIFLLQKYDIDISQSPKLMLNLIKQVAKIPITGKNGEIIVEEGGYISEEFFKILKTENESQDIYDDKIKDEYNRILDLIKNEKIPKKLLESVAIALNDIITIPGNLEKISLSMRLPIEGQAVFTNLEEAYEARSPFTKDNGRVISRGENDTAKDPIVPSDREIEDVLKKLRELSSYESAEVCEMLKDMETVQKKIEKDETAPEGIDKRFRNGLQEDMHLWIGIEAERGDVKYIEASISTLTKKDKVEEFLDAIAGEPNVLKYIEEKTGTAIRYLAAIRRNFEFQAEFDTAAQTVIRSAKNDYCVGVDFMGEELNETAHFSKTITDIAKYAIEEDPQFVIRVHAGENNANARNIAQVIEAVDRAFEEKYRELHDGQDVPRKKYGEIGFSKIGGEITYPQIRIGHGLYGPINDQKLMDRMADRGVVVEFNMTSNIRLNNLQPENVVKAFRKLIDEYSRAGDKDSKGIGIVFGTDGYGIYGTSMREEVEYASKVLGLTEEEIRKIKATEEKAMTQSRGRKKRNKEHSYSIEARDVTKKREISEEVKSQIDEKIDYGEGKIDREGVQQGNLEPDIDIFKGKKPIVIAGGSFGTDVHSSEIRSTYKISEEDKAIIDEIIAKSDPEKVIFVIGHTGAAQEGYLLEKLDEMAKKGDSKKFEVIAVMPTIIKTNDDGEVLAQTQGEIDDIESAFTVAQNPFVKGIITDGAAREGTSTYKAFQKRVFNKPGATLVAFEGEAPLANLIQEARNTGTRIFGKIDKNKETIISEKVETLGEKKPTGSKGEFKAFESGEFEEFVKLCDEEVSVEERQEGMQTTRDLQAEEKLREEQGKETVGTEL